MVPPVETGEQARRARRGARRSVPSANERMLRFGCSL
jgi:hypothetical protein